MKIDLQSFTTSRYGVAAALGIGRFVPPRIGYRVTELIARWLSSRKNSPMTNAVRANQWVVANEELNSQQLNERVHDTFQHHTKCLYMYYRHLFDPTTTEGLFEITPPLFEVIKKSRDSRYPTVIVGIHMSNFDLVAYVAAQHGLKALGLALDNPKSGHQKQYKIRQRYGFDVVPASVSTIRQAEKRLLEGGTVLTGIDRPLSQTKYFPRFFGRPAALPVIHIHLALRTNAPVVVAAPIMGTDGIFRVLASDPIEMDHYDDKHTAITKNAEKVLQVAEGFIRQAPYQWVMFYPVWPDVIAKVPIS